MKQKPMLKGLMMTTVAEAPQEALQSLEAGQKGRGKVRPEDFIKATIKAPEGSKVVVKPISAHFFRVNFVQKIGTGLSAEYRICESAFVEVVDQDGSMTLVDHTSRPQKA